jgi:alpha-ketoglutarate-dependent taurine dioxygenase
MSRFAGVKPKAIGSVAEAPIEVTALAGGDPLPIVVKTNAGGSIGTWARSNQARLESWLHETGGVLFRGFAVNGTEGFESFVRSIAPDLLEYKERSTPRTEVGNRIYTSTEYPAHQHIALHNEFSYSYTWPLRIFFYAQQPAETGGETPIADSRKVYNSLHDDVRIPFAEKGVMYARNYGTGVDLTWQDAFQTSDKAVVEDYCRKAPLDWEWLPGDRLRTRQVRPAVARHPVTGEMVWFNQAHLFHVSNLGTEGAAAMRNVFAEEDLPRNAYYGDGSPISDEELAHVRAAIDSATVAFPWQKNDVLMLDNMLVAHGRNPYTGARRILAALAQPHSIDPPQRC